MLEEYRILERVRNDEADVYGIQYLVHSKPHRGFYYPYTLFIPTNVSNETSLIVEGANAEKTHDNINDSVIQVISESMDRAIIKWNSKTNFIVLTPCFPRIDFEKKKIQTQMLSSETLNCKNYGLERIDNQLVCMIKDAFNILKENNIVLDSKVILDGFSASAKFVNRFALLHPEIVKLVIAGACSGTAILPIKEIDGEKLLYPVGCGNIDEIDNEKIEMFKKIKQFYYMGTLDPGNNDPLGEKEDGNLISPSSITRKEADQLYKYVGKNMLTDRWNNIQKIYKELGVNAEFKTYEGYGHTPLAATEDVKKLLESEIKKEKSL